MICMKRAVIVGIFYVIVCVLLGVVLYIVLQRYIRLKNDFSRERIRATELASEHLIFPNDSLLKYFYEPKPDTTELDGQKWLGYVPTYTINSDALNERREYSVEKEDGVFRIVTIGDSFTFGAFVNTQDNYSERLEDILNSQLCSQTKQFEVINLGVSGYDISYIVERFRSRGIKYNPDLVIWLVNGHNFYQIRDYMKERELAIEEAISPGLLKQYEKNGKYYIAAEKAQREFMRRFGKANVLAMQREFLNEFSALYDGQILFAFFSQGMDKDIASLLHDYAAKRSHKTYVFNGLPDLYEIGGVLSDSHPSVYGHTIIAGNIFAYLLANGLYPCR